MLLRPAWGSSNARERARRSVTHPLVSDPDYLVKYLTLILRADNRGEGGILALATLVSDVLRRGKFLFLLGLFGAALLYADGMITPAISVMGAVEGLHVATPLFDHYVVPIAVVILIGLFFFQSRGTTRVSVRCSAQLR